MKREIQVVLLCEDQRQESFMRNYLIERGVHRRKIRSKISPHARGAAEQWVRKNYPPEVKTYRAKSNYQYLGLLTGIDADDFTLEERKKQLDDALVAASLARRGADEKIVLFVPRRNIETWILNIKGESVDETTNYKERGVESDDPRKTGRQFAQMCRQQSGYDLIPSLQDACRESGRMFTGNQ